MSSISCIVVEDEPLAAKILVDYIDQLPSLEYKGHFKNALLATEFLQKESVDLIFLDIHLPRLKGMNFLRTLQKRPQVIITTAYHQYAVEGFELNVVDYLLKPIEFDRFIAAVNKVRQNNDKNTPGGVPAPEKDFLFISVQKKKIKILLSEILFIESQREYIRFVTINTEYLTKMSTIEIESRLPPSQFLRVHRSFIVSISKIDSFTAEEAEINGHTIPIGRSYRDNLSQLLS